ncbi:transposase family protein [Streptomyces cellostaticus]|uniref:transposase family protein n=1 Tax=Streptomyces cellostaticus TaxID=67285 RepID=UPI0027E2AEBF|nr:transposase family protein [Streptomyces cellostaticus]
MSLPVHAEEIPGLLERLAAVPDPRNPRGVQHARAVVPALTAYAVLTGAASLLAVGEWIADALPSVLESLGIRPEPLCPKRSRPSVATVRLSRERPPAVVGKPGRLQRTGSAVPYPPPVRT